MEELQITSENYEALRAELVEANSNLLGVVMRDKEKTVDALLQTLKKEYRDACGGEVPYHIPVLTDKTLTESRLYRFCSRLPKGADLHVHDMSLLPAEELAELLKTHDEFCINTDRKSYDLIVVPPEEKVPAGYIRFREAMRSGVYSVSDLVENWTVEGCKNSGKNIWAFFEDLFERHASLSSNPKFAKDYYEYTFRYYCKKGIQHVEIHLMLTDSIEESEEYLNVLQNAYLSVKKDYPYFTFKIIGAGVKADDDKLAMTKKCFLNTVYAQENVKDFSDPDHPADFVIGFDLVNEEDVSLPLHAFAPMLLKAKKHYPNMKLYIHGGESLSAENENLIDAYLLGVSRVGHGLNLYRYPDLHRRYAKSEIALECCVISNQTLGYTKDIRNHPATEYLRTGVALCLCSDDPAYMEHETLTDDFFAATIGWDLSLADLKQLAINSLMYSGLDTYEKTKALKAFGKLWNAFIDDILENGIE